MVVKDGRFGPYVTDGTTNASLRRGDDVDELTVERAAELLAERRAAGPSHPEAGREEGHREEGRGQEEHRQEGDRQEDGTAKKATAKKAAAKKAAAKKTATEGDRARKGPAAPSDRRVTTGPRGRLVAFEGVDGCGKSTQAALLAERLGARAHLRARCDRPRGLAAPGAARGGPRTDRAPVPRRC